MERPFILHLFTSSEQASPFDVNMAIDAGWQHVIPYTRVDAAAVTALTQDAIFSRGPKGVARTGIFLGGRDAMAAADLLQRAVEAMVPPFQVPVFADPSGAYTTAAATVAAVEAELGRRAGTLAGKRIGILGGTGPVGRIAAVLLARAGARAVIASHKGDEAAQAAARETGERFGVTLESASSRDDAAVRALLGDADAIIAAAAAGVQVVNADQLASAGKRLQVAADVNAVPPAGIAGIGPGDAGKLIAGTQVIGIGALAIGNVKYRAQQKLLQAMLVTENRPQRLDFDDALVAAREAASAAR